MGQSIRSCAYGRYLILYGTTDVEVRIERVLHGARDIDSLFSESLNDHKS
ncbi:type II toxin-antitoxin system RelE/ParE family toxin [Pectobacterium carotovorum]|nr:type II toxin-antitoxin system RelE/ParE family toxin [Pectobacterium carotovorum]